MRVPTAAGVVAAAAVVGALVGAAIGLSGSTRHRARVTMLVARGSALPRSPEEALQGARTVSALVDTDAVDSRVAAARLGRARRADGGAADGRGRRAARAARRSRRLAARADALRLDGAARVDLGPGEGGRRGRAVAVA
jgi:hypothetical protein